MKRQLVLAAVGLACLCLFDCVLRLRPSRNDVKDDFFRESYAGPVAVRPVHMEPLEGSLNASPGFTESGEHVSRWIAKEALELKAPVELTVRWGKLPSSEFLNDAKLCAEILERNAPQGHEYSHGILLGIKGTKCVLRWAGTELRYKIYRSAPRCSQAAISIVRTLGHGGQGKETRQDFREVAERGFAVQLGNLAALVADPDCERTIRRVTICSVMLLVFSIVASLAGVILLKRRFNWLSSS